MYDSRIDDLAKKLVEYSTSTKEGDNVLIEAFDVPEAISIALIRAVRAVGGNPFVNLHNAKIKRELDMGATDEQYDIIESCSPGPFLELFGRGVRPGWTVWGNQADEDYRPTWKTYKYTSIAPAAE